MSDLEIVGEQPKKNSKTASSRSVLSELEAFKAEHGKYPTSNQKDVLGSKLYDKRTRLLDKEELTSAQRTAFVRGSKPVLPPKKDKAKLYEDFALAVQNFGRPPTPAKGNKHEYNLWHRICKAWKSGGIAEVQYRSVTSAAKDDDMGEAISKPRGVPSLLSGIV